MSLQKIIQTGEGDRMPQPLIEMQQISVGLLLIWDALGSEHHGTRNLIETLVITDWANKHGSSATEAFNLLQEFKNRLVDNPWIQFSASRDFDEGWHSLFFMNPRGNDDIMEHVEAMLKYRPFPDVPAKPAEETP